MEQTLMCKIVQEISSGKQLLNNIAGAFIEK